ncbi:MAG: SdpI family protein [Acidimicrobiales bacterium]
MTRRWSGVQVPHGPLLATSSLGLPVRCCSCWAAWRQPEDALPRNGFVGIRLPSTMRSDEAWAAGFSVRMRPPMRQ